MGKSGIYFWYCKTNGKVYVGLSKNIGKRVITGYYSDSKLNSSYISLIHKAILKYGQSNFIFGVLEYCAVEDLEVRENYYPCGAPHRRRRAINNVNSSYNINKNMERPII